MKKDEKSEFLKVVVESPAIAIDASLKVTQNISKKKPVQVVKKYIQNLGPGLVTGVADDDPSGAITYTQTGAKYGYSFLWLAIFTLPFMATVQEMCARIGLVTGRGLAGVLKRNYSRYLLYFCVLLLVGANTVNIGADIGAMAASSQLLNVFSSFSFTALAVIFTIISLALQIFIPYHIYAKYLKFLTLALLSYIIAFFTISHNWNDIALGTIVPHISFDKDTLYLFMAILGTTISPYLFFWETSTEVEKKIDEGETTLSQRQQVDSEQIQNMRKDVLTGMSVSNIVMFFIIGLAASTLFQNGITNIESAADAAEALRPLAGDNAALLFTVGIIGTGLLAIPVLAGSASYAVSEAFGWTAGLNKKLNQARAFYGVIIISMLIGLGINYIGIDPIKANIFAAVLNGLIAPILIVFILLVSNNKKIMGDYKNGIWSNIFGIIIAAIMGIIGIITILGLVDIDVFS